MFRSAQDDSCGARPPRSQRFSSPFTGSDTDCFFHLGHEDFPVADFSGLRLFQNRLDRSLRSIVADHDLEFNFWKKIYRVLGAAVDLAVSLLPAKSFYLAYSHSFNARGHQSFSHRLGFERLDDGLDFFHRAILEPTSQMASSPNFLDIPLIFQNIAAVRKI